MYGMSFLLIVPSLRFATIIMMQDFKISNVAHHSVLQCSVYMQQYAKNTVTV